MIKALDTVTRKGDRGEWLEVHGVRSVSGGAVAMVEVHEDFNWPSEVRRWEEPVENLELVHRPGANSYGCDSSTNDMLDALRG